MYKQEYAQRYRNKLKVERPWMLSYYNAYGRCKNKSNRYTQRNIKCFLIPDDVKFLWFRDNAYKMKKPSLDRIDGSKNYALDNCRFIELKENQSIITVKNYPNYRPWNRKNIKQYSKDEKFIHEWKGIVQTGKSLGISFSSISDCLRGKNKSAGGYIWKYAN